MTNREKLNSMAMIDMLHWIKLHGGCFLSDTWDNQRCRSYDKCYDCLADWLNEECENQNFSEKP